MSKLCECGCGQEVNGNNKFVRGHNRRGLASFTANGRWAVNFDKCLECGTTDTRHLRDGYCSNCARRKIRSGELKRKRILIDGWSREHSKCLSCGTTDIPHKANGLCNLCCSRIRSRVVGGAKERFAWATGFDKCILCNTTEFPHSAHGLCYNCYESKKRKDKGLFEKACPICGVKINKFGQHLAMLSKSCDKHKEVLISLEDEAVELFGSNLTSVQISEKVGISKDRILKLWHKVFSDEEIRNRGERIRVSKISGKNHYFNVKGITWSNLGRETYLYGEVGFRSTWEVNLAKYLDSINVDWEYEKHSFEYLDILGVSRRYWPDFYIPELEVFIEVKGYLYDRDAFKMNAVVKRYNLALVLFLEDEPEKLWNELILGRKKYS